MEIVGGPGAFETDFLLFLGLDELSATMIPTTSPLVVEKKEGSLK